MFSKDRNSLEIINIIKKNETLKKNFSWIAIDSTVYHSEDKLKNFLKNQVFINCKNETYKKIDECLFSDLRLLCMSLEFELELEGVGYYG